MYAFCQDLNVKAKAAVEHVNMKMLCSAGRAGKARGEKESVEEFIMRVECQSKGCPSLEAFGTIGEVRNGVDTWQGLGGDEFQDFEMLGQ